MTVPEFAYQPKKELPEASPLPINCPPRRAWIKSITFLSPSWLRPAKTEARIVQKKNEMETFDQVSQALAMTATFYPNYYG